LKRLISATLLIIGIITLIGCKTTTPVGTEKLGQEFQLAIGQTATFSDADLKVKFDEVIEDSRCPGDVVCFWAGRVSGIIEITIANQSNKTVLTQTGLSEGYANTQYKQYTIQFRVEPYPRTDAKIKNSDYRLWLLITETP
jgi:hypothetical protein